MKNLSFRGKRLDNGEWAEGGCIIRQLVGEGPTIEHNIYIANAGDEFTAIHDAETNNMLSIEQGTFYAVDPETVGQWTGLLDKNGKRIFEGDIIKGTWDTILIVFYDNISASYRVKTLSGHESEISYYNGNPNRLEVIGNIHDNPELIQGADHELCTD